jgi:hypothetical protein
MDEKESPRSNQRIGGVVSGIGAHDPRMVYGGPVPPDSDFDRVDRSALEAKRREELNQRANQCSRCSARDLLFMEARELRQRAEQLELLAAVLPSALHQLSSVADEALYQLIQRGRR